jgi:hypothetical protein
MLYGSDPALSVRFVRLVDHSSFYVGPHGIASSGCYKLIVIRHGAYPKNAQHLKWYMFTNETLARRLY